MPGISQSSGLRDLGLGLVFDLSFDLGWGSTSALGSMDDGHADHWRRGLTSCGIGG